MMCVLNVELTKELCHNSHHCEKVSTLPPIKTEGKEIWKDSSFRDSPESSLQLGAQTWMVGPFII